MHYEINVAHKGRHYFATNERSLTDSDKARQAFEHFKELFPESEGYKVQVRCCMSTSYEVSWEDEE